MAEYEMTTPEAFKMVIPDQSADDFAKGQKAATSAFLGRISLMYGVSQAVTEGKAQVRDFLLGGKINLGKQTLVTVGPYRHHALHFVDNSIKSESFDLNDQTFKDIAAKAKGKKVEGQAAKVGAEFLLWLPEHQAFATLHFAATAAQNADGAFLRQKQTALLTSEIIGNPKKRQWPIPQITDVPDNYNTDYPPPSGADLEEAYRQFLAPLQEKTVDQSNDRPR